eukprot:scaffold31815_cov118-Isochrysis_galbana.AAC.4
MTPAQTRSSAGCRWLRRRSWPGGRAAQARPTRWPRWPRRRPSASRAGSGGRDRRHAALRTQPPAAASAVDPSLWFLLARWRNGHSRKGRRRARSPRSAHAPPPTRPTPPPPRPPSGLEAPPPPNRPRTPRPAAWPTSHRLR